MKEMYEVPEAIVTVFDTKDIILTSGILDSFGSAPANEDTGWTGLY